MSHLLAHRFRRALSVIDKYFEQMVQEQEFFASPDGLKAFLKLLPDESLKTLVAKKLEKMPEASLERWDAFISVFENYCREVRDSVIYFMLSFSTVVTS